MDQTGGKPTPRPGFGALLNEQFLREAWRRDSTRRLAPLMRLTPLVRAHPADAILGLTFMLLSSLAFLCITAGMRWVVDGGFALKGVHALIKVFLMTGAVALVLAVATGFRIYFLTKLGERVVADLRKQVFRHVLGLDLTHFVKLRTGEVLSRLTADTTLIQTVVGSSISVAMRNIVTFVGGLTLMFVVSVKL